MTFLQRPLALPVEMVGQKAASHRRGGLINYLTVAKNSGIGRGMGTPFAN
jgi:hypothetical protein